MSGIVIPPEQEEERSRGSFQEPERPQETPPSQEAKAQDSAPSESPAAAPQEPVEAPRRTVLPADFDDKMTRLWKARADVLQTSRLDDMGRVVRPAIADPDEALRESMRYFGKFVRADGMEAELRNYLDGGPLPRDWVPDNTPSKSRETQEREMRELQAQIGREQNPVLAAARDYVVDPLGNIAPAFLQVFADTFVGLANFVTDVNPVDMKAVVYGSEAASQMSASQATASMPAKALGFAGKLGGELPAYLLGGGTGAAAKGAAAAGKGNALLQGAKAVATAPGTIMRAGGAIGSVPGKIVTKIGEKVGSKGVQTAGKLTEAAGRGAGAFGALGAVTTPEDRLEGAAIGAAGGVVVTASSALAKAAFRGMFRHTYKQLGKTEQEAMDALKTWAKDNKVFKLAGDTEEGYVRTITNKFVDAGMPGVPGLAVKKVLGYAVEGGIESTGFAAIDHEFWSQHHEAVFAGDPEALKALGAKLLGGAITLGAFHIPLRDVPAAQRRNQVDQQGEAPKPVAPEAPRETPAEPVLEPQRGGIAGEPVVTKLEGEPAPKQGAIDKATGTVVGSPAPLERLGWREVFPEAKPAVAGEVGAEKPPEPSEVARFDTFADQLATERMADEGGISAPVAPRGPVTVNVGGNAAKEASAFFPQRSAPGQQLKAAAEAGRGDVTFSPAEAEQFLNYVARKRRRGAQDQEAMSRLQAAESVAQRIVDAYGMQPQEVAEPAPVSGAPAKAVEVELPGTEYSFEIKGGKGWASPKLEDLLGIDGPIPAELFTGLVEHASLLSALQAKTLPGTEISSDGIKAVGTDGVRDGVMRTVRMGDVLESPLSAEAKWTAAKSVPPRGKDALEPDQQQVVAALRTVLSGAENLPQADRAMLSGIVEVLDTVAARNDKSVAETLAALPKIIETLGSSPTPEQASRAIKAVAESLTVKLPEQAIADMQARRMAEAGFIDVGAAAEPVKKGARSVAEMASDAIDATFRDQIRSIEKRGGDPGFTDKMRRSASESRTSIGKVMETLSAAEAPMRENEAAMMQMVEVDGVTKPRWDALLHREIEPANAGEAAAAEAMNKALLELWEIERQSGAFLSKPGAEGETIWFERSEGRTQSKMPRVWADGKREVYEDPAQRMRWFEKIVELNPRQIRGEKGVLRQRTAADLEKAYQEDVSATEIKQAERESSFEHIRTEQNVPYVFEGKQMLERDPFEAMRRIISEQASRASVIKEFGQEGVPDDMQREARTRLGLDPEAKGAGDAIERHFKSLPKQDPAFKKQATATMTRLQGKEPAPLGRKMDKVRRAQGIRRAAMTMLSGLRDIPSMFTEGASWGGLRNMAKAFDAVARHYPTERKRAERMGALLHEIGNLNLHEATDPLNKAADFLGEFGNVPGIRMLAPRATERFRTTMMSKTADFVLQDWADGIGRAGSKQLLRELDFNDVDAAALSGGTAPDALQNRFRHQMVQRATSRGRSAERSRFAASPYVQSLVDFTGYSSKRFYQLAREAKTAVDTFKPGSDATIADKAAIAKRLATRVVGLTAGGMMGDLLYYIVADGIEGKNGWNHYMRDLLTYPGKTIAKGTVSGILSGPLAVLYRAATSTPESMVDISPVTSIPYRMFRSAHDATTPKGWGETLYDLTAATGIIPQSSRLKSLGGYLSGAALGENTEFRDDAKLVSQFRQQEGMPSIRPTFDKQPAFYAALGKIRDAIDKADMKLAPEAAATQVKQQADAAIREALLLQPEENLAAAVRGMQFAENVDKQRLLDYVRDEKRFERMMMHDQMVSELAEAIGKEQGTNPTPFQERLDGAARIAAGKARNSWNKLVGDTIEDAAVARRHGQPVGTALRDLANRMSLHPDSLLVDDTLGDKDKKRWARMSTQGQRQRFLEGLFRERVSAAVDRLRDNQR